LHASSGVALLQLLDTPDTARRALFLAHTLASTGALSHSPEHAAALLAPMRRALAALPTAREVRALCVDVGALPVTGDGGAALSRAALHARFLGMSEIAFSQLGEEFSVESEAEHECFWQAEAD